MAPLPPPEKKRFHLLPIRFDYLAKKMTDHPMIVIAVCFLTMGFESAFLIYGFTKLSLFHPTFWDMPFFFLSHGGLFLTALLGFIYFMVTKKEAEKHAKAYLVIGYVLTFLCILFATATSYRDFVAGRNTLLIYVIVCLSLATLCTIDPFSYIGMVLVSEAVLMVALSLNGAAERVSVLYPIAAIYTLLAASLGFEVYFYQVSSSIAEEKYRRLSTHDGLTGLRNRRSLDYVMNDAHSQGVRFIIMSDVNRFKQINDENGHEFGDKVLKDVSSVFREQFGHHVYRYGGDEIVALSKSAESKEIVEKANAINKALQELYPDNAISISFGIAALEGDQDGNAIRKADKALYLAKHSEDHIHFFEE
jgi:diguanylate cyclase (GGDEF)-like protein